jgi:hypothetical protein
MTDTPLTTDEQGRQAAALALPTPGERRAASWAGWFMAVTFVTSIPAYLLYHSILHDHSYILGKGSEGRVEFAALLEVLLMISGIGVAVVMFPILKRQNERMALGYVASRIVESSMICVGFVSLLAILTLRNHLAASIGAGSGSLVVAGRTLVAIHDWTFVVGPGFCVGINDLLLGYLMYTTGLMPPRLALVGLVGGPLIFVAKSLVVLGVFGAGNAVVGIATAPVFVFEASFAIYLIVKGFRPSPVLSGAPAPQSVARP